MEQPFCAWTELDFLIFPNKSRSQTLFSYFINRKMGLERLNVLLLVTQKVSVARI